MFSRSQFAIEATASARRAQRCAMAEFSTDAQALIIQRSITDLAVVSMGAFGFRLGLGHVRTSFSLAIPLRALAVVDIARGI